MAKYKCGKGEGQYKLCKSFDMDYCADCPHGIIQEEETQMMSKADKMLEKLGYKKIEKNYRYLRYSTDGSYGEHIDFDVKWQRVRTTSISGQGNTHFRYLGMKELQAIQMKCKEMGWI